MSKLPKSYWRLLEPDEIMRKGDQLYSHGDSITTWCEIEEYPPWIGQRVKESSVRRLVVKGMDGFRREVAKGER